MSIFFEGLVVVYCAVILGLLQVSATLILLLVSISSVRRWRMALPVLCSYCFSSFRRLKS